MGIKRKKLAAIAASMIPVICLLLTGCADQSNEITRADLAAKVQTYASSFVEEYHKEEPIVIDGQVFDYNGAMQYGNQFFGLDWEKYGECMEAIKGSLKEDSTRLSIIYSDYVGAVNALAKYDNTDAFDYKTATSGALVSSEVSGDVTKLIKKINTDEELLKNTGDISPITLPQFKFDDVFEIDNAQEKVSYINEFSQNFIALPYLSTSQSNRVAAFLQSYDIEVGGVEFEAASGVTYFDENNVAKRLVVQSKDPLFSQQSILLHEIGHVSDAPYGKVASETLANTTALLGGYYVDEFDYQTLDSSIAPIIYEQSLYAMIINHLFSYGLSYDFWSHIYKIDGKITENDIIGAYDRELDSAAASFSEGYEIFWQINWKNAAYNDVMNIGQEYLYAALNAIYIWDLYGDETTRPTAVEKYHSLLECPEGFETFDDIGLIGDSNVDSVYGALQRFVIKNCQIIAKIYTMLETGL